MNNTSSQGVVEVNNARLYYEIDGKGLAIVFLPGFTLDTRMWDDQFEYFAKRFQVARYDLRGFGKSSVPTTDEYSHVEDLKALLDYLKIEHAYVVGLSKGRWRGRS